MDFESILEATLDLEGGYVNHPKDNGGATNFGVTQSTYDRYRDDLGMQRRPVKIIDFAEVTEIYRDYYWNRVSGPDLPRGLDLMVFDYAVNSGVYRASVSLQEVLNLFGAGLTEDGMIGPNTLSKINLYDIRDIIDSYYFQRKYFFKSLPDFEHFGRGWMNRLDHVHEQALESVGP